MCGNPEMHVTVCGMPQARYNELFDNAVNAEFGELTKEELTQGWHFCDSFDGLLLHPESQKEYACCKCNCDVTKAFAKAARLAVRTQQMNEIDNRRAEIYRILREVDDEFLLPGDRESMSSELDALDTHHAELAHDMREEVELEEEEERKARILENQLRIKAIVARSEEINKALDLPNLSEVINAELHDELFDLRDEYTDRTSGMYDH